MSGGSVGIKKERPINIIARPMKSNIQARVLLHILDHGHVVLTRGAIWVFIDSANII